MALVTGLIVGGLLLGGLSLAGNIYMAHKQGEMQDKQLASIERMNAKQMEAEKPVLEAMQAQSKDYADYCKQFIGSGQNTLAQQRSAMFSQQNFMTGTMGYPPLQGQNWTGNAPWIASGSTNTFTVGGGAPGF